MRKPLEGYNVHTGRRGLRECGEGERLVPAAETDIAQWFRTDKVGTSASVRASE